MTPPIAMWLAPAALLALALEERLGKAWQFRRSEGTGSPRFENRHAGAAPNAVSTAPASVSFESVVAPNGLCLPGACPKSAHATGASPPMACANCNG